MATTMAMKKVTNKCNVALPSCSTHPAPGMYLSEIVWNEGPFGDFSNFFPATEATGGGFSVLFSAPAYQQGVLHGGKQRDVPDVGTTEPSFTAS